jgi:hypothetical protein
MTKLTEAEESAHVAGRAADHAKWDHVGCRLIALLEALDVMEECWPADEHPDRASEIAASREIAERWRLIVIGHLSAARSD